MHEMFHPLRDAMAVHDDWPSTRTREDVIDAARNLLRSQEAQDAYIAHMAQQTLSPEALRAVVAYLEKP